MASVTTNKVYIRFTTTQGKDRIWSFNYFDDNITESKLRLIANTMINNKIAFNRDYRPASIVAIWKETVTKNYIVENS